MGVTGRGRELTEIIEDTVGKYNGGDKVDI